MNKKVKKKMSLNRETLRKLDDLHLQEAAGGHTHGTNVCSECTACASCFDTCMIETGVCYPSCVPTGTTC